MFSILKKEINSFFASPIAYLVIGIFLLINSLFLWIFKGDYNILHTGFADVNNFFYLAPWVFLFLIPAITMKSFADEFNSGTIEILKTRPITDWQIILGKFFAAFLLVTIALIPTLTYVYTVYQLGNPVGNLDIGSVLGSYVGLLFLAATYTAIGLFTSTLSKNQIVAFIMSVFITFFFFYGFDAVANLFDNNSYTIQQFGILEHFKSISRGVIDTKDVLFFISLTLFFLFLTKQQISSKKSSKLIFITFFGLLFINIIGSIIHKRLDLTQDKRYTLSKTTTTILKKIDKQLLIKVYLEGDFPSEFKRLQIETRQFLEELKAKNNHIVIQFINPNNLRKQLIKKGMFPSQLTVEEDGKLSEAIIFPWAEVNYKNKTEIVNLLPSSVVNTQEEQLQRAIENLEFGFSNAINNSSKKNKQKIAVLSGNGELSDIYLYSFLKEVGKKYHLAKFTLDSVATNPQKTLQDLRTFDLAIIAKPTKKFNDEEKLVLDQFFIKGGKTLWMIDNVQADQDSLFTNGKMLAYPRDLNLTDLFFSYGIRINNLLIKDLYAAKIPLATGKIGNRTQFKYLDWFYHPLVMGNPQHPITKNISPVRLQFTTQIDTLKSNIKKTPLLISSQLTKKVGTPTIIALQSIAVTPKETDYKNGHQLLAVLLEGKFNAAFKGRVLPFKTSFKEKSQSNKMIVIADGDIAKNQTLKGKPTNLSVDKWTGQQFGNKEFLLNATDYLLDDTGILLLRNKSIKINNLDKKRAYSESSYWKFINVIFPLLFLFSFGFVFNYFRKKKYQ